MFRETYETTIEEKDNRGASEEKHAVRQPVICTIIARNYLAYARCLTGSFLSQHPDGRLFVLLVDHLDEHSDLTRELFTTIHVSEIDIPDLPTLARQYTIVELCTAVKPFFLKYLFRHYDLEKLCYFDPDIYFYHRVDEIFQLLDSYGIVLIPHLLDFLDDEFLPDELQILQSGAYNLGFLGLSQHPELYRFLHWWQKKLLKYCTMEIGKGLFVDQRWMDLVPGLFSSVHIHRDPGCNVAYWNLNHRHVEQTSEGYMVNGVPLKFFHFSGFSTDDVNAISRHQTRFTLQKLEHLEPLFYAYRDCLLANGHQPSRHLGRSIYLDVAVWLLRAGVGRLIGRGRGTARGRGTGVGLLPSGRRQRDLQIRMARGR